MIQSDNNALASAPRTHFPYQQTYRNKYLRVVHTTGSYLVIATQPIWEEPSATSQRVRSFERGRWSKGAGRGKFHGFGHGIPAGTVQHHSLISLPWTSALASSNAGTIEGWSSCRPILISFQRSDNVVFDRVRTWEAYASKPQIRTHVAEWGNWDNHRRLAGWKCLLKMYWLPDQENDEGVGGVGCTVWRRELAPLTAKSGLVSNDHVPSYDFT
jgi:hypothetical protein